MKAVFLDFDGVLLNQATRFRTMDAACVARLNRLCRESGAGVVITSSWRHIGLGRCRAMLKEAGFTGRVLGMAPVHWGREFCRGDEIGTWLAHHPDVTRIVIVDDCDDMGEYLPELVRTETLVGLVDADVDRAIAVLNSGDDTKP